MWTSYYAGEEPGLGYTVFNSSNGYVFSSASLQTYIDYVSANYISTVCYSNDNSGFYIGSSMYAPVYSEYSILIAKFTVVGTLLYWNYFYISQSGPIVMM